MPCRAAHMDSFTAPGRTRRLTTRSAPVGGGTAGGTRVTGLNDQGQIVGSFQDPYTITQHGFVYQNGVFDPIDLNGTTGVVVVGINDSDQVAGTFGSNTGSFLATVNPPPPLVLFYQQVLGRDPDSGGLAYSQSALAAGASLADLRAAIAHSQEAQNDLNAIYRQVLGRDADNGGAANYENALGGGFTLGAVRGDLAQSTEGQNDLNLIYRQVLGRDIDNTSGFFTYTRLLASGGSLQDVRSSVAHSNEARNDLNLIYQQVLGRDIDSSGLATYQNALAEGFSLVDVRLDVAHSAEAQNRLPQGVSMQGPQNDRASSGLAGGFTAVTPDSGDTTVSAPTGPTSSLFTDVAFGNDTILGFDASQDAIVFGHAQLPDFSTALADASQTGSGTLLTLTPTQSVLLDSVLLSSLHQNNFQFV